CHAAELPDPAKLVKKLTAEKEAQPAPVAAIEPAREETKVETLSQPAENQEQISSGAPEASADVLALARDTSGQENAHPTPMPQTFKGVIDLFESRHEGVIGKYLFDDVSLVAFKPGAIDFKPVNKIPATLPSRMKALLEEWTGKTWTITISKNDGEKPLKSQEDEKNRAAEIAARNHPLVKKALDVFPGAEIIKINPLNEEE
ncbi:MAG: hypothetical protein ACTSU8_06095, partial [Alphaproteobacteria bacterium]